MSRFLSEALEAREPYFRLSLQHLEASNGHPNTDIRLSTQIMHATKAKLGELNLDPHDTTPAELYHGLQQRVKADDVKLTRTLRPLAATHISAEADVVAGMVHALQALPDSQRCYALKASSLKSLLKKQPPKRALKHLGYRSLDSFLKHETPAAMLVAAWLSESTQWQQRFLDQYKKLKASDFENRSITITQLKGKRWDRLVTAGVAQQRHNILSFKELGALVFLPLPEHAPAGSVTASLSLALHELNEIRAGSTFLKLSQVRKDFGHIVQTIASAEPQLTSEQLDQPVPWNLIQRYYAGLNQRLHEAIFEPYVQLEDMAWHSVEQTLATIEPAFSFWKDTAYLGLLHNAKPVSCNVVDAALNYCNQLPFEQRLTRYFKRSLWHELLLKYLQQDAVERSVLQALQPQLAVEMATA